MLTLFFSGTGNSAYVAGLLAAEMGGDCLSIEEDRPFDRLIRAAETVAFVYPIYGSCMPRILRMFVRAHREALHGKQLVILCTQMMFSGDGAHRLTDELDKGTYTVRYAEHIVMPNNVNNLRIFPQPKQETVQKLADHAKQRIAEIGADIRAGKAVRRGFAIGSRLLGLTQAAFMPFVEKKASRAVRIGGDCNGCGLCVKRCPMHNLTMENGRVAAHGDCTLCYRCINLCPQRAIRIYFKGKVNWQFHSGKNGIY